MTMNNIKSGVIVQIPWASEEHWTQGAKISGEADSYTVPLIYRATRLRCNYLTRIPRYIYNEQDEDVPFAFESQIPLRELLWLSEASVLLRGAAWLLKLKNRFRYGKGLQWLNPFTIQWVYKNGELLFWQQLPTGERYPEKGYWTADDFIYIREFTPADDVSPGVSAAQVALNDAQGSWAVSKFLSNFFPDAIPVTMLNLPFNTQEEERKRVETWFKRMLGGMRNKYRERVIAVKGNENTKIEKLTSDIRTFDFPSIDNHTLENIAHSFEMPKTMLSSASSSYATASVEMRAFTEGTLIPRTQVYEQYLNPFLETVGQRLEFAPEELPEMQEDETIRASSLSALVAAGIPLLAALDMLGYDLSEEAEKLIEEAEKKKEEAAKNPPQIPTNGNMPTNGQQPNGTQDGDPNEDEETPVKTDLDKWLRKSLNRISTGKSPAVEFESDVLSAEMKASILKAVENAKDSDEVRRAFGLVKENL